MRIHELAEAIPADTPYVYIYHAPDGICKVLRANGDVCDGAHDHDTLAPAESMLFDNHWRGANATEVARHLWPRWETTWREVAKSGVVKAGMHTRGVTT